MATKLRYNSILSDIFSFNKKYVRGDAGETITASELIDNILELRIDTYNFSYASNLAARSINDLMAKDILNMLSSFSKKINKTEKDYDKAYCGYYIITYYYRVYDKMDELYDTISKYEHFFLPQSPKYALTHQIRGRYYRRIGDIRTAISCDKSSLTELSQKNMTNIGVNITLASSISIALENRENYVTSSDISNAIQDVSRAINNRPRHARYYYLLAKLEMFTLLQDEDIGDVNRKYGVIKKVKNLFRKAIELDDIESKSHAENISEYKSYLREADLIFAELHLMSKMKQLEKTTDKRIKKEFSKQVEILERKLQKMQGKYLEILAVFVSIVAVIMAVIGTFSSRFKASDVVLIICSMNCAVLAVYTTFIMLIRKIQKKYVITLLISLILEGALIVISRSM